VNSKGGVAVAKQKKICRSATLHNLVVHRKWRWLVGVWSQTAHPPTTRRDAYTDG
jgi:hypothetical protein